MKDKTLDRILQVVALIIGVLLVGAWRLAGAQSNHHNSSGDDEVSIETELAGGDVTTRSLALGQSLGDVDIAGCIVTTQWGIIIWQRQKYEYDVFCLADKLDQVGKYAEAAELRCTNNETASLYGSRCLAVMNFEPVAGSDPPPATTSAAPARSQEEPEDRSDRLDAIEARLDREQATRRAYARQLEADKQAEAQRAQEALDAYKDAGTNE